MDTGLINIPQSRWDPGTGRQVVLKSDFANLEAALLQVLGLRNAPTLRWVDATSVQVPATADSLAQVMMCGFPNVLHPGSFVSAGLADGKYRENSSDTVMDFDLPTALWGMEKSNQWYVNYALAGAAESSFSLKAMPYLRVKSQASQVISLGTLYEPSSGLGYGFSTDELAGAALYVLSGASQGLLRTISANNNDNGTGGTLTYAGDPLTLAQGDWLAVLPATNFRWVGDIYNDNSGNIIPFVKQGPRVSWKAGLALSGNPAGGWEDTKGMPPLATVLWVAISILAGSQPGGITFPYRAGDPPFSEATYYRGTVPYSTGTAVEFCKYTIYSAVDEMYALGYAYPAGCGF